MILFTSGSTGRPKGVMHSHGAVDTLIRRTADFWETGPEDRLFVPSPIGHIGGSIYAFEFPWITGCTALLAEGWDPDDAVSAIDTHGATFMAGATPFLAGLIAAAERAGSHLPSLRRFICGGASVPPELVRRGLEQFPSAVVSRAYGSTEVPLVCPGVRDRREAEQRADTDGECTAELQILSDSGTPVADGESGEIVVRAPQMLLGYLDPADDEGSFTAGRLLPDGRPRPPCLRPVPGDHRAQEGHHHPQGREHQSARDRECARASSRPCASRRSSAFPTPRGARSSVAFVLPVDGATLHLRRT